MLVQRIISEYIFLFLRRGLDGLVSYDHVRRSDLRLLALLSFKSSFVAFDCVDLCCETFRDLRTPVYVVR